MAFKIYSERLDWPSSLLSSCINKKWILNWRILGQKAIWLIKTDICKDLKAERRTCMKQICNEKEVAVCVFKSLMIKLMYTA